MKSVEILIQNSADVNIKDSSCRTALHVASRLNNSSSKSNVKVILNGRVNQIHWPEQNATSKFIPPIVTMVELELDQIMKDVGK